MIRKIIHSPQALIGLAMMLYSFTVTEEVMRESERHIRAYVAANTDKKFKSLQILEVMI